MATQHRAEDEKETDGLYAIDKIEKSVQKISARTFLATWEVEKLMTAIAYQQEIKLLPSAAIACAIHQILQMMTDLVENTSLTSMEIRDLMITVC